MKVRVVTDPDQLVALGPAWAELADAADVPVYAAPFWALTWWRHLGRGALAVRVVEDSAGLVAVLALHGRTRAGRELLRFFGDDFGAVSGTVVAPTQPEAGSVLWDELLSVPGRVVDLRRHRLSGPGLDALWRSPGRHWSAQVDNVCPVIAAAHPDEFLRGRGSRLRRVLTRAPKLAAADGLDVERAVHTDFGDVERLLPEMQTVWDAAEAAHPRTHFLAGAHRGFTLDLLRTSAEQGRLALCVTRIGGELAGCAFGYRVGRVWYYSGPRFHPDRQRYSPGHLTLQSLVEHALGAGDSLDLLLGGQDYKWQWSTGSYSVANVLAASSPGGLRTASAGLRGLEWAQGRAWRLRRRLQRSADGDT
jgi:CelD/BcsL family acetyltransferase involved in cellulose biosynthesis